MTSLATILIVSATLWLLPLTLLGIAYLRVRFEERRLERYKLMTSGVYPDISFTSGSKISTEEDELLTSVLTGSYAYAGRRSHSEGARSEIAIPIYDTEGYRYVEHRLLFLN